MLTTEDRDDLLAEANRLCYQYIRLSGLSDKLATNADDDALAEQMAGRVLELMDQHKWSTRPQKQH